MNELIEFLNAQIGEDERRALAVEDNSAPWPGRWVVHGEALKTYNGWTLIYKKAGDTTSFRPGLIAHIARHDPARVLREVKAKRRIMARHSRFSWADEGSPHTRTMCEGCGYDSGARADDPVTAHVDDCPELRDLASVYENRPGWKERWRVS